MSGSVCMTYCNSAGQCNSYWIGSDLLYLSEIVTHFYGKIYLYTEQLVNRDHSNEVKIWYLGCVASHHKMFSNTVFYVDKKVLIYMVVFERVCFL